MKDFLLITMYGSVCIITGIVIGYYQPTSSGHPEVCLFAGAAVTIAATLISRRR